MSDRLRVLLESWLVDAPVSAPKREQSENEPEKTDILLGTFGNGTLPGGNYPILDALTTAYLDRDQPNLDGWMRLLETHVARREDPHVWLALSIQLHNVLLAPPQRAERFLDDLFARFPEVRDSRSGITLIVRAMPRISAVTIARWMANVEASPWKRKTQAIGELLPWSATRPDAPESARERLANEVLHGSEAMRRGIAYSAANLWHVIDRRSDATHLLVALVHGATGTVAEAILSTFRFEPPFLDEATRRLLYTLSEHPHVVASDSFGFIATLRDLLPGGQTLSRQQLSAW